MRESKWVCDICENEYEREDSLSSSFPGKGPNLIGEHPEKFCFECYSNGLMWSMKQVMKSRARNKITY